MSFSILVLWMAMRGGLSNSKWRPYLKKKNSSWLMVCKTTEILIKAYFNKFKIVFTMRDTQYIPFVNARESHVRNTHVINMSFVYFHPPSLSPFSIL